MTSDFVRSAHAAPAQSHASNVSNPPWKDFLFMGPVASVAVLPSRQRLTKAAGSREEDCPLGQVRGAGRLPSVEDRNAKPGAASLDRRFSVAPMMEWTDR